MRVRGPVPSLCSRPRGVVAGRDLSGEDYRIANPDEITKDLFDLTQLDTKTSDLYLMVKAA